MSDTESPAIPSASVPPRVWHPWRLVAPLLVLTTVLVIWVTRHEVLMANHWAYPLTLAVVGAAALMMAVRARPRRPG